MAAPRKSAVAMAARERARAQAEEITRRNEKLIELAAEFFVQDEQLSEIDADLEKKIQELKLKAEEKRTAAHAEATSVVQRMIDTGEAKKSIADRLGLTPAELKKYLATPAPVAPVADDAPAAEAESESVEGDSPASSN